MSGQHTQGRLTLGERQRDVFAILAEIDECPVGGAFSPDDARRLVACWNATIGIPTEQLEAAGNAEKVEPTWRDLKDQRDELLAALKEIATTFHGGNKFQKIARAAIAKAQGGAV